MEYIDTITIDWLLMIHFFFILFFLLMWFVGFVADCIKSIMNI